MTDSKAPGWQSSTKIIQGENDHWTENPSEAFIDQVATWR